MREDSLEAPTRHPIDWQNPGFYDEAKLFDELDRVYDICHGCRRCVSLCGSFPTLFDLVDNSARFRSTATPDSSFAVRPGAKTPGKVAIFSTCYVNYNEPGIGHDLIRILKHNEIAHILVEKENCCGMPKLELGDLNAVRKLKDGNIPVLAWLAREGYAILTAVQEAMFDPFEYLVLRHKDGLLKTDFKQPLGKVSYHIPCHLRVQNMGQKTRELMELVPGTKVNVVERCSGHDGTWGVKTEFFKDSMRIGKPVFKAMARDEPDYVSSDCAIAGRHILQGMGNPDIEKQHPLSLVRIAYGL